MCREFVVVVVFVQRSRHKWEQNKNFWYTYFFLEKYLFSSYLHCHEGRKVVKEIRNKIIVLKPDRQRMLENAKNALVLVEYFRKRNIFPQKYK